MTWPLAAHLRTAVLGPPGDNLEYVWKLWWFREALLVRHVSPFFNPDIFYPFGYPVALSETTLVHTLLGLPLTALWGEVVAYNVMVLASFVLSGYGVFLLCRQLGTSAWGGLVAGAAFAFCPYRLSHLGAGHLPLMGTGWIALLFLALERHIARPTVGRGALVGLAYALLGLSSWYYAAMIGLVAALYLALRARPWREVLWRGRLWLGLLVGGAVAAVLLAPAAWPTLQLYRQGLVRYGASLAFVDRWSASPADFLWPNAMHSLWGGALTRGYYQNINENLLYLGWVALALAGLGAFWQRRRISTRAMVWLGALAVLLAMGTTLHWAGQPVRLSVGPALQQFYERGMFALTGKWALNKVSSSSMRQPGSIVLPLPTLLLYLFVPLMNAMRVWTRFGIVAMLVVSVLAAWGVDALRARLRSAVGRSAMALGLLLLVLVDFSVASYPYGYTQVAPQPLDLWLAQQPDGGAVIHYPLAKTWYGWLLYPNRVHGHPLAYGYGTFAPDSYVQATQVLAAWPSEASLQQMQAWGIRYVAMGVRSYGAQWPEVQRRLADLPVTPAGVWYDAPRWAGDRLLHLVKSTDDVPVTELVGGDLSAYLDDEIHLYIISKETP
jgi:hypothetical protein